MERDSDFANLKQLNKQLIQAKIYKGFWAADIIMRAAARTTLIILLLLIIPISVKAADPEDQFNCQDTTPCGFQPPCSVQEGLVAQPDSDCDGVPDSCWIYSDGVEARKDSCVCAANSDQKDSDNDHIGDACDVCPFVYNPNQNPSDCLQQETCGDGIDNNDNGVVDYCDSDCSCDSNNIGCSACGVCSVSEEAVNTNDIVTVSLDITSDSSGICTIDFGDGTQSTGSCIDRSSQHAYSSSGVYTPKIISQDGELNCPSVTVSAPSSEICGDGLDNDNNGLVDYDDQACTCYGEKLGSSVCVASCTTNTSSAKVNEPVTVDLSIAGLASGTCRFDYGDGEVSSIFSCSDTSLDHIYAFPASFFPKLQLLDAGLNVKDTASCGFVTVTQDGFPTSENCADGIDNDADYLIDYDDPDCTCTGVKVGNRICASCSASPLNAQTGELITYDVSVNPTDLLSCLFLFGDGSSESFDCSSFTKTHTFSSAGEYVAQISAAGVIKNVCEQVTITGPESITLTKTATPSTLNPGGTTLYEIVIEGSADEMIVEDTLLILGELTADDAKIIVSTLPEVSFIGSGWYSIEGQGIYKIHDFSGKLIIKYQASAVAGVSDKTITNEVTVDIDDNQIKESVPVTILGAPLTDAYFTVSKGVTDTQPSDGSVIGYSITVKNIGGVSGDVTVTDTIGQGIEPGVIYSDSGAAKITFIGSESVTGWKNGKQIWINYEHSLLSPQGITIKDLEPGAEAIISYSAKVDSSGLESGVEDFVDNKASVSGDLLGANVRIILKGNNFFGTSQTDNPPAILPIPAQILTCGEAFPDLYLDSFIVDDEQVNDFTISVSGNSRLQVQVDQENNKLIVTDPVQGGPLTETLRITLYDDKGRYVYGSVQYKVLDSFRDIPLIAGIPDQVIESDEDFDDFRLSDYVQIGDSGILDFYAVGSELLSVTINDDSTVKIEYPEELFEDSDVAQISEAITFGVIGCREAEDVAVFTVVNEDLNDNNDFCVFCPVGGGGDNTCAISTGGRLYDDTDCDGIIDVDDNCPLASNTDQRDTNRDGVGDACDITVSCSIPTGRLIAGQSTPVDIIVTNNLDRDMSGVRLKSTISNIGVSSSKVLSTIKAGESRVITLFPRLPECVQPGKYALTCEALSAGFSSKEIFTVNVQESDACNLKGESTAEFFEVQDVIAGSPQGSVFPISITNDGELQRTYVLKTEGIRPWGDFVFESGSVVVVPAGQKINTNLRVFAPQETMPGDYPFRIIITSGEDQEEVYMVATVISDDNVPYITTINKNTNLLWLTALILLFLSAIGYIFLSNKKSSKTTYKYVNIDDVTTSRAHTKRKNKK